MVFSRIFPQLLLGATAMVLTLVSAGCSFDNELNDRRCLNDSACVERFGVEWVCDKRYCQKQGRPQCSDDAECQAVDTFTCNGLETCDPESELADDFGCVPGDVNELIDDKIDCTTDLCDESRPRGQKIINDPSGCECQDDGVCEALNTDKCSTPTCDPASFTCVTTAIEDGQGCDDGVACTKDTTCQGGVCGNGTFDHDDCQDGSFCNGEESCVGSEAANPVTGCDPGVPPTSVEGEDDGIECTVATCIEGATENQGEIVQAPLQCECETGEDCRVAAGDCFVWTCDPTSFTCVPTGETIEMGASCTRGFECSTQGVCNDQGNCLETKVNLFCSAIMSCDLGQTATCVADDSGDAVTGCACL